MEKQKKIKTIKIVLTAIAVLFLFLIIVLIVQNIQLHKLNSQEYSNQQKLAELEENNNIADKKIEELSDPSHNDKFLEQEKNYGGENDYIFN